MLQGNPVKFNEGCTVWVEDPEIVWIDGHVLKVNGNEVEVETSDGRTVNQLFCSSISLSLIIENEMVLF